MLKNYLKSVIENNDTVAGKYFDVTIQTLIVISLISFILDTEPTLPIGIKNFLKVLERISVLIFTVEYLLRLYVADRKFRFIFSFFGLIDLLAILPFYLSLGIDLRSVRIFRLFRLFRMLKLLRYSKAINHFKCAFQSIKEELFIFFMATVIMLYIASIGIYYFESAVQPEKFGSVIRCMWWAVMTLTTVGYGDVYPITPGGKVFTSIISLIGIGLIAVPSGLLASALSKSKIMEKENDKKENREKNE